MNDIGKLEEKIDICMDSLKSLGEKLKRISIRMDAIEGMVIGRCPDYTHEIYELEKEVRQLWNVYAELCGQIEKK